MFPALKQEDLVICPEISWEVRAVVGETTADTDTGQHQVERGRGRIKRDILTF